MKEDTERLSPLEEKTFESLRRALILEAMWEWLQEEEGIELK